MHKDFLPYYSQDSRSGRIGEMYLQVFHIAGFTKVTCRKYKLLNLQNSHKNKKVQNFKKLYEKEENGEEAIRNLERSASGHNNEVQKVVNFKLYLMK